MDRNPEIYAKFGGLGCGQRLTCWRRFRSHARAGWWTLAVVMLLAAYDNALTEAYLLAADRGCDFLVLRQVIVLVRGG